VGLFTATLTACSAKELDVGVRGFSPGSTAQSNTQDDLYCRTGPRTRCQLSVLERARLPKKSIACARVFHEISLAPSMWSRLPANNATIVCHFVVIRLVFRVRKTLRAPQAECVMFAWMTPTRQLYGDVCSDHNSRRLFSFDRRVSKRPCDVCSAFACKGRTLFNGRKGAPCYRNDLVLNREGKARQWRGGS